MIKYGKTFTIDKNIQTDIARDGFTNITRKYMVKIAESFDNEILRTIVQIAQEEGLTDLTILNKREIVLALRQYAKSGHWVDKTKTICGQEDVCFVCSECGNRYYYDASKFKHCPECGARMDLEVNDA